MLFRWYTLALVVAVSSACSDTTRAAPSASLSVVSGGHSSDTILAVAATPLVVEVRDSAGQPAVHVTVSFKSEVPSTGDTEYGERGVYTCPIDSPGCSHYDEHSINVRYGWDATTDSLGRARLSVQYGVIAGPVSVLVTVPALGLSTAVPYRTLPGHFARVAARVADTAVYVGHSYQLDASAADQMGNPIPGNVTVYSTNRNVATVTAGRVTAVSLGRGRIVMQSGEFTDTAFVSIPPVGRLLAHDVNFTLLDTDGGNRRTLIAERDQYETASPIWNVDGSEVVLQENNASSVAQLFLVDTLGARRALFAPSDNVVTSSQSGVSHSGKLFFYGQSVGEAAGVYSAGLDGSNVTFIAPGVQPAPSPDGSRLAYIYGTSLVIRDLSSGTETTIATDASSPKWSPSGTEIEFIGYPNHIYLIHPDGTNRRAIAVTTAYDDDVSWSPDGEWLVASHREFGGRARGATLELIRVSDGERLPIPWTRDLHEPAWRPF